MRFSFAAFIAAFSLGSARRLQSETKHDQCYTDSQCYVTSQSIKASFTAEDAIMQSWVGIYPYTGEPEKEDLYRQPLHSVWSCDHCEASNEVVFDVELEPGTYVAQSHGIGHFGQTTFAQSKPFIIKPAGAPCIDNLKTNLRVPTATS